MSNSEKALQMHEQWNGKLETTAKAHVNSREDLAIAYTPGVAEPCKVIAKDPEAAYKYTIKSNTVAVVSDGSAVLGLGNIGALAAMPVMEGKAVLFKEFGGVNAVPICLDTQDTEEIIRTVVNIAPAFGGINLEDISAPRCFEIETRLKELLDIPVFHDDQHGTAIVVLAGIINALKVTKKEKDGVTLKWEISQPYLAEGYEVERKNAQGEYVHCSTIKSSEVNTKDIELWNYSKFYGKNITFRVKAYFVDEDGTIIYSQPSNTVKTTFCPVQPKITSLTKKAGKKLTVKWKKSDYAIGYQVWRSVDGKKGVCIKTIKGGDVTSFTDTNLKEGTTYIYWIKSYRMDYQNKKIYSRSNDYSKSIVY